MPDVDDEGLVPWGGLDMADPKVQIFMLAKRVETLGREKEALERALETEVTERKALAATVQKLTEAHAAVFNKGLGVLIVLPIIGVLVSVIFANIKSFLGVK